MRHLNALLIKFLIVTLILNITLVLFFGLSPFSLLFLSPVLSMATYLVGDLLVQKVAGNFFTTIADFAIVFIIIWGYGRYSMEPLYTWSIATVYSSFLITGGEWFIHSYLLRYRSP